MNADEYYDGIPVAEVAITEIDVRARPICNARCVIRAQSISTRWPRSKQRVTRWV